jgi:4-hydroxyphenylacetate 3-monooxygenase
MEYYPQFVSDIRELLGSHPFQQPANSGVFTNAATKDIFSAVYMAPAEEAVEKYRLFKLAWDLVGTEFASHHTQYEMFYAGPKHVTRGRLGFYFDWSLVDAEAEKAMASISGYAEIVKEGKERSSH